MSSSKTFILIERIGNLLRAEQRKVGSKFGLLPVHLQVLDYLSRCNKSSNTPAGVVKYFGITKGTASQSIKVLESKSYITKHADKDDKRWIHLNITSDGNKVLKKLDEFLRYDLIESTNYPNDLESGLLHILKGIQRNNSYNSFGVCKTCRNFIKEGKNQFRCGLTKQVLTPSDSEKICVEHKYRRAV